METIEKKISNDPTDQLKKDALRHQRDEDLRDDDMINNPQVGDSKLPGWDNADEDDQTLKDDDIHGRDLDTDNNDEWNPANVSEKDLDQDDLEDNDEVNQEIHQIKDDKLGSLGRSITNEAEPDPNEIPEEQEGDNEFDVPDNDRMEQGEDDEVSYHEPDEVTPPSTSESDTKTATLGDVDSTFTDDKHGRTTGRLLDHEPGSGINPPEHGAYNL